MSLDSINSKLKPNAIKRSHLLFLTSWYPNKIKPTLGNFIEKHAEACTISNNVSVLHVCSDDQFYPEVYSISKQTINQVFAVIIYYSKMDANGNKIGKLKQLQRYFKAHIIGFNELIKEKGKPDIINLNVLLPAGIIALWFKIRYGIPYFYTEHWTGFLKDNLQFNKYSLKGILYRYAANKASGLVTVTNNLKRALNNQGIENINTVVIPNVVDTNLFQISENNNFEKFKFIHISHAIDEHKNVSGILRAVAKLSTITKNFELQIISDGDLTPHIETADKLGINKQFVTFESTKTTSEIASLIAHANCLLLFSNYENFPCVIPESFSCGIPVISTNVGGISEYVTEQNGILIPPKNEHALVEAMRLMMDKYSRYNKKEIRNLALEQFSYEAVDLKFSQVINQIINT